MHHTRETIEVQLFLLLFLFTPSDTTSLLFLGDHPEIFKQKAKTVPIFLSL